MTVQADIAPPQHSASGAAPLRAISFCDPAVSIDRRDDGTIYLRPKTQLGDYPARITDRLHHWADVAPDRVFMAERDHGRLWRQLTYGELLIASRHIASALLARGLSAEKPVVILSGNSIDHALVAFGALYAGIPLCPVSRPYSLDTKDDADKFSDAIAANVPDGTEIAAADGRVSGRDVTSLADLMAAPLHPALDST